MNSLIAELLLLRRRAANWVILGFWSFMAILFSYLLPYYAFTSGVSFHGQRAGAVLLVALQPQNLVINIMNSFPFFGGTMVLILGVLSMGSEFSWGTLTPIFTQRAGRLKVFFSKMLSLAIALVPFILTVFLLGFTASMIIAWREGQAIDMPPLLSLLKGMGAAWIILAAWASFGVLLAVLSRGTALAIGLGIIYGLVLEGLITAFGREVDLLNQVSKAFLRTNSYSLISSLGVSLPIQSGPGGFVGPSVSGAQSFIVLVGYILLFVAVSATLVRWRDVSGSG